MKVDNIVSGPDLRVGTVVYVREVVPTAGESWEWGDPSYSGVGVTPPSEPGGYASFEIMEKDASVEVELANPAFALDGSFSILKHVTGPVAGSVDPKMSFIITYFYEGMSDPATLTIHDGETVTSPTIPTGTVVTISEIAPTGTLPGGGGWGTPTFVLADGTTSTDTTTVTIGDADIVAVQLDNPTLPPLPVTGSNAQSMPAVLIGILLLLIGGAVYVISRRRRQTEMG